VRFKNIFSYKFAAILFVFILLSIFVLIKGYSTSSNKQSEPPNLGILKLSVRSYIESGSYEKDIEEVVSKAIEYLYSRYDKVKNPAAVFDIDETSLSNLEYEYSYDFGYNYQTWIEWVKESKAKAIKPTLKLYNLCLKLNVATFFITGRNQLSENLDQDPTVINLKKEGYYNWKKIYFKPINSKLTTIEYKSQCRKEIEDQGYTIIINIGDQYSDLLGGYSEKTFKLPNPMYYIP